MMSQNKKIWALIFAFVSLSANISVAFADIRADGHQNKIIVGGGAAELQKAVDQGLGSKDYGKPGYTPPPEVTHVYAVTENCQGYSVNCNIRKCTYEGNSGVLLHLLEAPVDAKVQGIGTHIDWNNTDALVGWKRAGSFCTATLEALAEEGVYKQLEITLSQEDFQSLPLAPAQLNLPNAQGHTLKNANTNIWAKAETQNLTTEINGAPVQVEATPVAYVFTYGDGQKLETTNPGYPLHEDDGWDVETPTSHIYKETGNYPVSVTTIYTGRYSVDGGPWLPVNGTAQATSEEKTVRVWRVRAGNVADTCVENPKGWGCPGT